MDKRPVLLLIEGITASPYIMDDVKSNTTLSKLFAEKYSTTKRIKTTEILDWGLIGGDILLKYTDVTKFLLNPIRRSLVTGLIERTVAFYNALNIPVHLLCHSLGCIEALDSNAKVDKVILTGCPLEFCSRTGSQGVRTCLSPFPWSKTKLECKDLLYFWSEKDFVSCRKPFDLDRFIKAKNIFIFNTNLTHDLKNYLTFAEKFAPLV